ncbi:hypothetical protein LJ655_06145 [Paraburkholderia sp. MMS20-SJTN17]|uniref:Outer membrane protein beta-barrel domain-containing protein n=1 Tax=Paraburkholderia translucens TaxID=2886945 RepID=A0ABS8K9N8_9BURK|nr:hypothetical protein [Paraburkholderia sp. MMS20-SJTN17]MCC8401478.1 hypothetical protein [Paraburkholderia sp. MMS20-SJTN17]
MGAFTRPFFIGFRRINTYLWHFMRQFVLFIVLIIALATGRSAYAQWQFSGAGGVRYATTEEVDTNGNPLVKEHGFLPGLEFKANYRKGDWLVTLGGEFYGGNLSYDGQMQNGTSFSTDTRTRQFRVTTEAGRYISDAVLLLVGTEWDYWKRDILGRGATLGMQEEYNSWRFLAGAQTRLLQASWSDIYLTGLLVVSSPEHLEVNFDNQLFDQANLTTKAAIGARFALEVRPKAYSNVSVESDFEWMRVGRSGDAILTKNGSPVGTVAQPEHVRKAIGIKIKYRF